MIYKKNYNAVIFSMAALFLCAGCNRGTVKEYAKESPNLLKVGDERAGMQKLTKSRHHLDNCNGGAALDLWAFYASAGPEYISDVPLNSLATEYFEGNLENFVSSASSMKTPKSWMAIEKPKTFYASKFAQTFFDDAVTGTYRDMCVYKHVEISLLQEKLSSYLIDSESSKFWTETEAVLSTLLLWEARLHNITKSGDINEHKLLIAEMETVANASKTFNQFIESDESVYLASVETSNLIRFTVLYSRARAKYAITANSPLDMMQAVNGFRRINTIVSEDLSGPIPTLSPFPIYYTRHRSPFTAVRFTAANNNLHWMEAITQSIEEHPEWLLEPDEAIEAYRRRLLNSLKNHSKLSCPLPTTDQIDALIANQKNIFCGKKMEIKEATLKVKKGDFFKAFDQFQAVVNYEDSSFLWAKAHQQKYSFFSSLSNNFSPQSMTNRLQRLEKREYECTAKKAYLNVKRMFPEYHDGEQVKHMCK